MSTKAIGNGATMTHRTKIKIIDLHNKSNQVTTVNNDASQNEYSKTVYNNSDLPEINQIYKRT